MGKKQLFYLVTGCALSPIVLVWRKTDQRNEYPFQIPLEYKFVHNTLEPLRKYGGSKICERPTPKAPELHQLLNMILKYPKTITFEMLHL